MTNRIVSRFAAVVLVGPIFALAACVPAHAPVLSQADTIALNTLVAPPVACSDLRPGLVNAYSGCQTFGQPDYSKGSKTSRVARDAALVTAVSVRCRDIRPEQLKYYSGCARTVAILDRVNGVLPDAPVPPGSGPNPVPPAPGPNPEAPAPTEASNVAGPVGQQASTSVSQGSGGVSSEATAGGTHANASSGPASDGGTSFSTDRMEGTLNSDGSVRDVTFK